jgi:hypothetical protein
MRESPEDLSKGNNLVSVLLGQLLSVLTLKK